MDKSVFVQARDLSPEKRKAAELLLGTTLGEDELLSVRSSAGRILKPGLSGEALEAAYRQFYARVDDTARKAERLAESEIDDIVNEAIEAVR